MNKTQKQYENYRWPTAHSEMLHHE